MVLPRAIAILLLLAPTLVALAPSVIADHEADPPSGDADAAAGGGDDASDSTEHTVIVRDFEFEPQEIWIEVGDRITFINEGGQDHYILQRNEEYEFNLEPGQSRTVLYSGVGTQIVYCHLHCANYRGRLICHEHLFIYVEDPNDTRPNNAPVVDVAQPLDGSLVWGLVDVEGEVTDIDGANDVVQLGIRVDGGNFTLLDGTPSEDVVYFSYRWNATAAGPGAHWIEVAAVDSRGAYHSQNISVEADPEATGPSGFGNDPPRVVIDSPREGAELWHASVVRGSARDPDGDVVLVEARFDGGPWIPANGTSVWHVPVLPRALGAGAHTIEVRAFDGISHSTPKAATFVVAPPAGDEGLDTHAGAQPDGSPETRDTPGLGALVAVLCVVGAAVRCSRRD